MVSKTITISEDAYRALQQKKLEKESFSDTILRLTKRFGKIMESFGKLDISGEEEKIIKEDLNKVWANWSKVYEENGNE